MSGRAAIVTGGSSGIGFAIAQMLVQEGYALTVAGRRTAELDAAVERLAADGGDVGSVTGDIAAEDTVRRIVAEHRTRFGRLDVLVNNAGLGSGAAVAEIDTHRLDLQIDVNLRSLIIAYRESVGLLRAAAAEHRNALVVNTASVTGLHGQPWLSVYSATKAGIIAFTQAMNRELGADGIKSCALCPALVDTKMTDFVKESRAPAEMIRPQDIAEAVRMLLRLSPACMIPELVFQPPGIDTESLLSIRS